MECSVVNGALEYLAKDLGIAENAVLQGMTYFYMLNLLIPFPRVCKGTSAEQLMFQELGKGNGRSPRPRGG